MTNNGTPTRVATLRQRVMWWTLRVCAFGLLIIAPSVGAAKESVSIRVSPAVSIAPADLVIRASIEPDANNRAMAIVANSEQFYRSSLIQLEGDGAPKTATVTFHSVPSGEYEIAVMLIGADGHQRALARAGVRVVDSR